VLSREALAVLAEAGLVVVPVETRDASDAALILLKAPRGSMSPEQGERLRLVWIDAVRGTPLEAVRVLVVDAALDIEVLRRINP